MEEFITGLVVGALISFVLMLWISIGHCELPAYVVVKSTTNKWVETKPIYYIPYDKKYAIGDTIRFY